MKSLLTIFAAMFMTFAVIGCGGGDNSENTTDDTEHEAEPGPDDETSTDSTELSSPEGKTDGSVSGADFLPPPESDGQEDENPFQVESEGKSGQQTDPE